MILSLGDLALHTITADDIEMIRQWRNTETVNKFFVTTDMITEEDQKKWFASLDPATSIYFLLRHKSAPFGLAYASAIDSSHRSFEGNIFIGHNAYRHTYLPVKAALILSNLFFEKLDFLTAYSIVHILNEDAIDLDKKLGYAIMSMEGKFSKSCCTRENYLKATAMFRSILFKEETIRMVYEQGDERFPFLGMTS